MENRMNELYDLIDKYKNTYLHYLSDKLIYYLW